MPESRKRQGHHYQKPADIPRKQRVKGRTIWALLLTAFALIVAFFAAGANYIVLTIAAILGAVIGYYMGKAMEKEATRKQ